MHTLLDLLTLIATVWVIFTMRRKLLRSYNARKDSVKIEYIVRPRPSLLSPPPSNSTILSWEAARCLR